MIWTFKLYGRLFIDHPEYNLGLFWSVIAPPRPYLPSPRRLHRAIEPSEAESPYLVEIPFSALPYIRIPFYATLFRMFAPGVFDWAVRMHGRRRPMLHMLFHLIDLFDLQGTSLETALERTPGLGVPIERRRAFVAHAFERMTAQGQAVSLRELARDHLLEAGLAAR